MARSRVALIHGDDRYDNAARALECLAAEISLEGVERLLVKSNLVMTQRPLAAVEVAGNAGLAACRRPFRRHDTYERQQRRQMPGADVMLRAT